MPLIEDVVNGIVKLAHGGRTRVSTCATYGVSCEGWLKVELLHHFSNAAASSVPVEVFPERDNIDLTFQTASERVLLELKTFPTNYGRGGGKPVTNFIERVADDLHKLAAKRGPSACGVVAWLAYFVPDPEPSQWANHVAKVKAIAAHTRYAGRIPLWEKAFANLYIMESK